MSECSWKISRTFPASKWACWYLKQKPCFPQRNYGIYPDATGRYGKCSCCGEPVWLSQSTTAFVMYEANSRKICPDPIFSDVFLGVHVGTRPYSAPDMLRALVSGVVMIWSLPLGWFFCGQCHLEVYCERLWWFLPPFISRPGVFFMGGGSPRDATGARGQWQWGRDPSDRATWHWSASMIHHSQIQLSGRGPAPQYS